MNTNPFARIVVIFRCFSAIYCSSSGVSEALDNRCSMRPTSCPTSGVIPISAPIAKTITVKKMAFENDTAAKSAVP